VDVSWSISPFFCVVVRDQMGDFFSSSSRGGGALEMRRRGELTQKREIRTHKQRVEISQSPCDVEYRRFLFGCVPFLARSIGAFFCLGNSR